MAGQSEVSRPSLSFHPLWLALHGLVIVTGLIAIASIPASTPSPFGVNRIAPQAIQATTSIRYVDRIATRRERRLAADAVPTVYKSNVAAAQSSGHAADELVAAVIGVLQRGNGSWAARQREVDQLLLNASVPTEGLPELDARHWRLARTKVRNLLASSIQVLRPFSESGVQRAIQVLDSSLPTPSSSTARVTEDITRTFIKPTLITNTPKTHRLRQEARSKVQPVIARVAAGAVIVHRGELISPAIFQELKAVGLPGRGVGWQQQVAMTLFALTVVGLGLWYVRSFYPEVTANQSVMLLLDGMLLVSGLAARLVIPGHSLLPYFFPIAGATALCGLLVSSEIGVTLAVALALEVGWLTSSGFGLTSFFLLSGIAGAMAVRQIRRLNDFLVIGLVITVAAGLVIAAFHLVGADTWTLTFVRDYGAAAVVNGLFSAAIAFGGFVVLGNALGATTTFHLLELGHPDQPLLRRLMADAPGTYNHSLVVASMVERAAQVTNSNVLLARVMALYHDIGKIANPLCFVENQVGSTNIHDDLMPNESAEIIRAHVSHGEVLAKQHRLPVPIRDAILQHHGTMTMAFFFHRALQANPNVDAEAFSYHGPRPLTKEAALLMLADGCEGAVRAMPSKSPEAIRDKVDAIIDDRVATGQLSRCNLTLRDLAMVRTALVEVLNGIYHPRVEYPTSLVRKQAVR